MSVPVQRVGPTRLSVTQRGSSRAVVVLAAGAVFTLVGIYLLWIAQGIVVSQLVAIAIGTSGLCAVGLGAVDAKSFSCIELDFGTGRVSSVERFWLRSVNSEYSIYETFLQTHSVTLLRGFSAQRPWEGYGLVLWMSRDKFQVLQLQTRRETIDTAMQLLPEALSELYRGEGSLLIAKY